MKRSPVLLIFLLAVIAAPPAWAEESRGFKLPLGLSKRKPATQPAQAQQPAQAPQPAAQAATAVPVQAPKWPVGISKPPESGTAGGEKPKRPKWNFGLSKKKPETPAKAPMPHGLSQMANGLSTNKDTKE